MSTFGPAYEEALDKSRLTEQLERIRDLMVDGDWRTLGEIAAITGDPEASVSAQLRHLRKPRFGAYTVEKRRRGLVTTGLWEYRVGPPAPAAAATTRARRSGFTKGLMYAAKILLSAPDLPTARAQLKSELLKAKR